MRLAISTGGGDAPGLNAVIRAIVLSAHQRGWETFGIRRGYDGLLPADTGLVPAFPPPRVLVDRRAERPADGLIPLTPDSVRGIIHLGGTILGTSNRGNPYRWPALRPDGTVEEVDRSDELVAAFHAQGFEALIAIGGDGSLSIAYQLWKKGIPIVGVPKTIDNDVWGTESTFGFDTAVATATDAIDKVHSTAESHDRVMVVELMGRNAGWIALHSGLSGGADVILIPEIPFDIEKVCDKIRERDAHGRLFSIVAVSEGARPVGGSPVFTELAGAGTVDRLGGIGAVVAREIAWRTGKETRSLVLGHLQRGGTPTTFDRLLGLRFGSHAVRTVAEGDFGECVVLRPPAVSHIPLAEIVGRQKLVPLDSGIILTARNIGVSLGD
jgi:6-phosphofructokinase 1